MNVPTDQSTPAISPTSAITNQHQHIIRRWTGRSAKDALNTWASKEILCKNKPTGVQQARFGLESESLQVSTSQYLHVNYHSGGLINATLSYPTNDDLAFNKKTLQSDLEPKLTRYCVMDGLTSEASNSPVTNLYSYGGDLRLIGYSRGTVTYAHVDGPGGPTVKETQPILRQMVAQLRIWDLTSSQQRERHNASKYRAMNGE
ncbi:hypothetical protein EAF00_005405 [Botryotinia globosa]|nr:hypothetical protein EAF00_005405 [Botryotinia globosa]